jgi:hypothetical protein
MRSMASGAAFHRAYQCATQQAFLEARELAFEYFEGVFQRLRYGAGLAKHKTLLHEHGILPVEIVPNAPRKNSADIALVIDVVLAACSDGLDGFCIMSSDSDYTRLALTLRERGKPLVVIGRSSMHPSLRSACSDFINLDSLLSKSSQIPLIDTAVGNLDAALALEFMSSEQQAPAGSHVVAREKSTGRNPVETKVDPYELISVIGELIGERGTTNLKAIQATCSHRYTDFSPRICGAMKWTTLLQRLAVFRVDPIRDTTGRIRHYAVGFLNE